MIHSDIPSLHPSTAFAGSSNPAFNYTQMPVMASQTLCPKNPSKTILSLNSQAAKIVDKNTYEFEISPQIREVQGITLTDLDFLHCLSTVSCGMNDMMIWNEGYTIQTQQSLLTWMEGCRVYQVQVPLTKTAVLDSSMEIIDVLFCEEKQGYMVTFSLETVLPHRLTETIFQFYKHVVYKKVEFKPVFLGLPLQLISVEGETMGFCLNGLCIHSLVPLSCTSMEVQVFVPLSNIITDPAVLGVYEESHTDPCCPSLFLPPIPSTHLLLSLVGFLMTQSAWQFQESNQFYGCEVVKPGIQSQCCSLFEFSLSLNLDTFRVILYINPNPCNPKAVKKDIPIQIMVGEEGINGLGYLLGFRGQKLDPTNWIQNQMDQFTINTTQWTPVGSSPQNLFGAPSLSNYYFEAKESIVNSTVSWRNGVVQSGFYKNGEELAQRIEETMNFLDTRFFAEEEGDPLEGQITRFSFGAVERVDFRLEPGIYTARTLFSTLQSQIPESWNDQLILTINPNSFLIQFVNGTCSSCLKDPCRAPPCICVDELPINGSEEHHNSYGQKFCQQCPPTFFQFNAQSLLWSTIFGTPSEVKLLPSYSLPWRVQAYYQNKNTKTCCLSPKPRCCPEDKESMVCHPTWTCADTVWYNHHETLKYPISMGFGGVYSVSSLEPSKKLQIVQVGEKEDHVMEVTTVDLVEDYEPTGECVQPSSLVLFTSLATGIEPGMLVQVQGISTEEIISDPPLFQGYHQVLDVLPQGKGLVLDVVFLGGPNPLPWTPAEDSVLVSSFRVGFSTSFQTQFLNTMEQIIGFPSGRLYETLFCLTSCSFISLSSPYTRLFVNVDGFQGSQQLTLRNTGSNMVTQGKSLLVGQFSLGKSGYNKWAFCKGYKDNYAAASGENTKIYRMVVSFFTHDGKPYPVRCSSFTMLVTVHHNCLC